MCKFSGNFAVGLWVLSVALMLYGTSNDATDGYAWGLFIALAASGFTTWMLSERRDHMRERTIEHIAEVVAAMHEAREAKQRHLR